MSILPEPQPPSHLPASSRVKQPQLVGQQYLRSRNPADRLLWVYGRLWKLELRPFLPSCLKPRLWGGLRWSLPQLGLGEGFRCRRDKGLLSPVPPTLMKTSEPTGGDPAAETGSSRFIQVWAGLSGLFAVTSVAPTRALLPTHRSPWRPRTQVLRACLETPRVLQTLGLGPRRSSPPSAAERAGVRVRGEGGTQCGLWSQEESRPAILLTSQGPVLPAPPGEEEVALREIQLQPTVKLHPQPWTLTGCKHSPDTQTREGKQFLSPFLSS